MIYTILIICVHFLAISNVFPIFNGQVYPVVGLNSMHSALMACFSQIVLTTVPNKKVFNFNGYHSLV